MDVRDYFDEFEKHLIEDGKPSVYFNALAGSGKFPATYPFSLLTKLKSVPQSPIHHPEGDVWNHTMLVVDSAAERKHLSREPRAFMWAALLHDLGKITNTKLRNGRITAYEHDVQGEELAREFLNACIRDETFIAEVCALVRWHMQPLYVLKRLPFANLKMMAAETDAREVALLSFCDRLGRGELSQKLMKEEMVNVEFFLQTCGRVEK